MNTFSIITKEIQQELEQQNPATEGLPNICGYMGRACRQMGKEEGANRAICMMCPLAQFARMKELYRALGEWSNAYYNNDAPLVTDEEYDRHMQELKHLESAHPEWIAEDSPTQNVGGKRVLGIPVTHTVPMLSLEDVFTREDVENFVNAVQSVDPQATFSVEEKIDGLSLSLEYRDGKLVRASTRGDGHEGEDVTENVRQMKDVPQTIRDEFINDAPNGYFEVRGECYMRTDDFETVNARLLGEGKNLFANARNCAAGTLRQADPAIVRERGLSLFVFDTLQPNAALSELSHGGRLNLLESWKFPCVARITCHSAQEVWNAIEAHWRTAHKAALSSAVGAR